MKNLYIDAEGDKFMVVGKPTMGRYPVIWIRGDGNRVRGNITESDFAKAKAIRNEKE